ncbi:hypothetical protein EJM73_08955 [Clostridium botulinum]|uniref:hypothetical protein n=1 Tax=Clostridium botulinum TaxID=1491 RepID=UPI0013757DE5|nr:hypothetical protein [Clostridium botulinum]NCI19753.1 hypothetical protein [Clostridium botulinum]NCI35791.1 hypothetical protein [Clostridium botulinum]NCI71648.1 hypothetical protein [Clostridium botulinum]NDI38840.1 hypothetical protein [Clostridium botulinum]
MNGKLEWYNDGIWKCNHCESIFKSSCLGDMQDVQFCPYCSSTSDLVPCDEDGNEVNE